MCVIRIWLSRDPSKISTSCTRYFISLLLRHHRAGRAAAQIGKRRRFPRLDRFAIKLERSLECEEAMEYTKLGNTGMDVSRICLGCIDEVVLATKVHGKMHADRMAPGYRARRSCEINKSLKRLGTDYVDLYQIHRWDYQTPIEETIEALHDLVRAGKVRISVPPPCSRGSSERHCTSPRSMAGPASSTCRITSTSSTAKTSGSIYSSEPRVLICHRADQDAIGRSAARLSHLLRLSRRGRCWGDVPHLHSNLPGIAFANKNF